MAMYTYSIAGDFPGSWVSLTNLTYEILAEETITTTLSHINNEADDVEIVFNSSLTAPEITALDNVVATHDNTWVAVQGYSGVPHAALLDAGETTHSGIDTHIVTVDAHHNRSHAVTSTADHTAGNWKVLYTDGSGNVQELALGADGDSLVSNGTAAAPYFTTISGTGGGGVGDELPCLQIRRTTSYVFTTSFVDITFDTTDIENEPSIIEHNNTNTDRIDIKEDGLYKITYTMSIEPDATAIFTARVRKNDTTVIPGSQIYIEDSNDIDEMSNAFIADLVDGDFLTLQLDSTLADDGNVNSDIIITVIKLQGAKGDQGDPGSGSTIQVYDGGTPVTGTPFEVLNFEGATISGSPTVSGGVDVTVSAGEHDHDDRYYTETEVDSALSGKSDTGHQHTESDITDLGDYATSSELSTVSGTLQTDIDSKADTGHQHTESDITDLGDYATSDELATTSGTLQDQIDTHSHGGGLFGTEFHQDSSDSESSTTSESYQQKLRLTTSSLPSGTYYIQWSFEFWADGHPGWGRVQIDDSETTAEIAHDSSLGDLDDGYTSVSGFIIKTAFSGVKNIDIDYRTGNDNYAFYIRRARLTLWRIS